MVDLEKRLLGEILSSFDKATEMTKKNGKGGYNPTYCKKMIRMDNDIVLTCKKLLQPGKISDGFIRLVVIEKLPELTIEYIVSQPCYESLFTEDEIKEAKKRLGRK